MLSHQTTLAVAAGLFAHNVVFIRGEWHLRIKHILVAHAGLWLCTLYVIQRSHVAVSILSAVLQTTSLAGAYLAALFTSMSVYRLFFHKLARFPGPKLAAVSKLWHVWNVRKSTNHLFMTALHKKYGSVVRTGPNEISIFHPNAIHLLDGWGNTTTKDIWYDVIFPKISIVFTRSEQHHKEGLKAWTQALGNKSMMTFNARVSHHVKSLCDAIVAYGNDTVVPVNDLVARFTFDIIGDVLFSQDYNLLGTQGWHPYLEHRADALPILGPINDVTWLGHLMFCVAPFWKRVKDWFYMVDYSVEVMEERLASNEKEPKMDMASFFIDEYNKMEGVWSQEKRMLNLQGTSVTAAIAGSDTTTSALICAIWSLANHPEHVRQIREEIAGIDINDSNALGTLPHLGGFINEVLRVLPPAMSGAARVTGPDGMVVDGVQIPAGVKVTAPKYAMMRLESAFVQPNDFIPERWHSKPELIIDRRAFGPFSVGPRACVGKPLAYTQLRLVVASLVTQFEITFAAGYEAQTMWRELKDQVTAQPGPVRCVFTPRKTDA